MSKKSDIQSKKSVSGGLSRLLPAFRNSREGLRQMWRTEESFRMEVILFVAAVPLAFLIGSSPEQIGLLIGSVLALLIVEILNTAIEVTIDRVGTEWHDLSKLAKDLGSAAVLLTTVFPLTIWAFALVNSFGCCG